MDIQVSLEELYIGKFIEVGLLTLNTHTARLVRCFSPGVYMCSSMSCSVLLHIAKFAERALHDLCAVLHQFSLVLVYMCVISLLCYYTLHNFVLL